MRQKKEYYTIPQLAKKLGISRIAVYQRVKSGKIKASRAGKIYLIPKEEASKKLTDKDRRIVEKTVDRAIKEYGEALKRLGDE